MKSKHNGYDLYGGTPPHEKVSTSKKAAQEIEPTVSQIAERVFRFVLLGTSRGATCDEVEQGLSLSHQTVSARLRELALKDRIRDSGNRRVTRSDRDAIVWTALAAPAQSATTAPLTVTAPPVARRPQATNLLRGAAELASLIVWAKQNGRSVSKDAEATAAWLTTLSQGKVKP